MGFRYDDVVARHPELKKVPLVGVIKEVAPTKQAETDEKLGVGEFQKMYFNGRKMYLDEDRAFYKFIGNRKITDSFKLTTLLRPWKIYGEFKAMGRRMKSKKIEGNMVGDGIVQGGLLVVSNDNKVLYKYEEKTGSEVPLDDFEAGFLKLSKSAKVPAL